MPKNKINTSNLYPYKKIVLTYFSLAVVLITFIFYLLFSKALILITFEPEKISSNFAIKLGSKTNLEEDAIKGEMAEEIREAEKSVLPIQLKITETKASGEVTIINNYNKNQTLVATTRLLSPEGLLFRITDNVVAPRGGKVKAKAVADQLGKEYEIGPAKFIIPGLWPGLQDKIYAQSDKPMTREFKNIGIINTEEIEKVKKELKEKMTKDIKDKIKPQIVKSEVIEESTIPDISKDKDLKETEEVKVKVKMKFIAVKFSEKEMDSLIKNDFKKLITPEKELLFINRDVLFYSLDEKTGKIKVSAEGNFVPNLENLKFPKEKLVGLKESEVKEYFNNFPIIKDLEIKIRPIWLKTMPLLSDKIEIKIVK